MKRRGRPPKVETPFVAITDLSLERRDTLSLDIAELVGTKQGELSDALALAAASFLTFETIKCEAPLAVKRRGNRPNIHLAVLLMDCALAYQNETGKPARTELQRIGERTENTSEIITYARAVLAALNIRHPFSLRQQAKQALKYL